MRKKTVTAAVISLWVLSLAWLLFLVWLSSQNGTATAHTSMRLTKFIVRLFGLPAGRLYRVDHLLRTLAHYVGFFLLGGLFAFTARATWPTRKHRVAFTAAGCCLVAVLDEMKKGFIAGRHPSWPEAGLNVAGVLCGAAAALGILWAVKKYQTTRRHAAPAPDGVSGVARGRKNGEGQPI